MNKQGYVSTKGERYGLHHIAANASRVPSRNVWLYTEQDRADIEKERKESFRKFISRK